MVCFFSLSLSFDVYIQMIQTIYRNTHTHRYANASEEIKKRHIRVNRILGEAVNCCVRECNFEDEEENNGGETVRPYVLINAVLDSISHEHLEDEALNALRDDPKRLEECCREVFKSKLACRRKIKKRPLTGRWDPIDVVVDDETSSSSKEVGDE